MSADRAVEPVPAVPALHFRKPLLFFALGAALLHLALLHVVRKQQSAARALLRSRFFDGKAAVGRRTDKNSFAAAAPVLSFCLLTTDRAFLHGALLRERENFFPHRYIFLPACTAGKILL